MYRKAVLFQQVGMLAVCALGAPVLVAQAPPRQLGTVKGVDGRTVTMTTAAGGTVSVAVPEGTPVLELPPGSKDLKEATAGTFESVATGDRVLVTGKTGDSATLMNAARIVLMKGGAIAAQKASQQAEWQRNGMGGLVRGIDGQDLTVAAGAKSYKVATTQNTIFRRYAADSVAFSDAKPGTLGQVRAGDQISVRGPKSNDGMTITADEVVTGTFENLSGVITAVDPAAMTLTLKDLQTKKTVVVQVTPNSDLRKLSAQAAAGFASRTHAPGAGGGSPQQGGAAPAAAGEGAGSRRAAGLDLSRLLVHLPTEHVADLKPGDAVMIVASEGRGDALTVITMLSGVEQLLSAPGAGSQPITLSPWNLGAPEGGGGA